MDFYTNSVTYSVYYIYGGHVVIHHTKVPEYQLNHVL